MEELVSEYIARMRGRSNDEHLARRLGCCSIEQALALPEGSVVVFNEVGNVVEICVPDSLDDASEEAMLSDVATDIDVTTEDDECRNTSTSPAEACDEKSDGS